IKIEGMSCGHCQAKVESALNAISGVEAKVDLKKKAATVNMTSDINDSIFKNAITDAGFEMVSIEEKKGLFGR
ncbi:MAG: Heavy metal transport/detoxification protein, partial [Anaerocolumna sp.]|nr:Heavy metal transport/detoxification protein [Anaerocolumna sp.]